MTSFDLSTEDARNVRAIANTLNDGHPLTLSPTGALAQSLILLAAQVPVPLTIGARVVDQDGDEGVVWGLRDGFAWVCVCAELFYTYGPNSGYGELDSLTVLS